MSYKWPSKDKDEILDFSIDWSRPLGTATVDEVTWYCEDASGVKTLFPVSTTVNSLTNNRVTKTDTVATIYLEGGTNNTEYKLWCSITTSTGLVKERSVKIRIKEYR